MKEIKFDKRASKYDEGFEGKLSKRFYDSLTNACFYNSTEMNRDFVDAGFSVVAVKKDFYVQTLVYVKL